MFDIKKEKMTAINIPKEMQKALPHVNFVGNAFWYAMKSWGKLLSILIIGRDRGAKESCIE